MHVYSRPALTAIRHRSIIPPFPFGGTHRPLASIHNGETKQQTTDFGLALTIWPVLAGTDPAQTLVIRRPKMDVAPAFRYINMCMDRWMDGWCMDGLFVCVKGWYSSFICLRLFVIAHTRTIHHHTTQLRRLADSGGLPP